MTEIVKSIKNEKVQVQLIFSEDDICSKCPNLSKNNICKSDTVNIIDNNFKLNIPSIPSTSNGNTFNNDMSFEINLPNVTNYEQFIYTMQRDKRFEKIVQSMTTSRVIGKSSLNKFTIK